MSESLYIILQAEEEVVEDGEGIEHMAGVGILATFQRSSLAIPIKGLDNRKLL
jgi:hypothetical protein